MRTSPVVLGGSPVRRPPAAGLPCRQVLLVEGVRSTVEGADRADERRSDRLHAVPRSESEPSTCAIAALMPEAGRVSDAVHRFRHLASVLPERSRGPSLWLPGAAERSRALPIGDGS
jgi:hypothetical protein